MSLASELKILKYRQYLQSLLPLGGNKYTILAEAELFLEEFLPYINKIKEDKPCNIPSLYILIAKINLFIKKNFPEHTAIGFEKIPPLLINQEKQNNLTIGRDEAFVQIAIEIGKFLKRYSPPTVHKYLYQYNYLLRIYTCLNDYGLHPEITNRDKQVYGRYNVIVRHQAGKKNHSEAILMRSIKTIFEDYIGPFHEDKPIIINGLKIKHSNITRLTITLTLLKDEEIELYRKKYNLPTDEQFTLACEDVTNELFASYRSQPKQIWENQQKNIPFIGELMRNLNISEIVLDAYFSLVPQPQSKKDVSEYYVGKLYRYYSPFQTSVYDAYPIATDYQFLEAKITSGYFDTFNISKQEIDKYLRHYGEGFQKGYHDFENNVLSKKTQIFNEPEDRQQIIFDFATGSFFKGSGFPETHGKDRHLLSAWKEAGVKAGYFYRSWYIILENSKRFEPLFKTTQINNKDNFAELLLNGIQELQSQGEGQAFIKNLKSGAKKDEASFRNWFKTFFSGGLYYIVEAEPLKGNGRIDLKVRNKENDIKIIEFKGWWNKTIYNISKQTANYLTDFDPVGYVVIINHLKRDVLNNYKESITKNDPSFIKNTWEEIPYKKTGVSYFQSKHKYGNKSKTLVHLIYRLYP